jgi:outer membrane receptor protein involved in Fe transport
MKIKTNIATGLFFLSLASPETMQGQTGNYTISGTVMDNHSNLPLFYATVGLLQAEDSTVVSGTTSDEQGKFKLSNVKSGSYILVSSYIGYEISRQPLSVSGENREIVPDTVRLKPSAATLQGVTIADQKPVYTSNGEKTLYNVSQDLSVQTGTAADALQNAPGVEVDIEGNITLRGVSSVEIWINDRPSKLDAENLKTYIQQLPANSLERIEVITNPSARYTSKGTGGIINIVTKSNIKKNTFLSFGINGSTKPMLSPWISYLFANEKFSINLYAWGHYHHYSSNENGYNVMLNDNGDTSSYKKYTSKYDGTSISTGIHVNGSYTFDTMNQLSFGVGFSTTPFNKSSSFQDYKYEEYLFNAGIYDYSSESKTYYSSRSPNAWIGYEHKFNNKGHKIDIQLYGNLNIFYNENPYNRLFCNYPEQNKDKISSKDYKHHYESASIDYTLPYSEKGEIAIGLSGDLWSILVCYRTDTLFPSSNTYVLDSMRFVDMWGKISDMEGYLTVQQKFGPFTVKGGIRFQNNYFNVKVLNQPEHNNAKDFPSLFPSLHLSYASKSMHNLTLSYSRRVNYPSFDNSTTLLFYQEDSYYTGNKNLRPTFSNSIEAGWTKYFTKFGSVGLSAYFKNAKDEINEIEDVIYNDYFGRYVNFTMPINSGKSHRYGLDADVFYKVKSFMNIRLNAGVYQSHSQTVFREIETVVTDNFTYSFRLSYWAKLWKFLEVNLSGNYRSARKTLFLEESPVYALNIGLRSDFWKRKLSVFINVQDVFNWNRAENSITNPYYIAYSSARYNSRFISAGVTFRFGKMEMEQRAQTGGKME